MNGENYKCVDLFVMGVYVDAWSNGNMIFLNESLTERHWLLALMHVNTKYQALACTNCSKVRLVSGQMAASNLV